MFLTFDYASELLEIGRTFHSEGIPNEASFYLQRVISLFPGSVEARRLLGENLCAVGKTEQGVVALRRAQRIDPQSPAVAESLKKALHNQLAPSSKNRHAPIDFTLMIEKISNVTQKLSSEGHLDEALVLADRLASYITDRAEPLLICAKLLIQKNDLDKAIDYLNRALKIDLASTQAYLSLAKCYIGKKDEEAAKNSMMGAIKCITQSADEAGHFQERHELTKLLNELLFVEEALANVRELVAEDPKEVSHRLLLAEILIAKKEFAEAEQVLGKAIQGATDTAALGLMVKLCLLQNQPQKALEWINSGGANLPMEKFSNLAFLMADIFEAMGDYKTGTDFLWNAQFERYEERIAKRLCVDELVSKVKRPAKDEKLIVFVADEVRSRALGTSQALRRNGWKVVMLTSWKPNIKWQDYFDDFRQYDSADRALLIANEYSPRAYHVFSGFADWTTVNFARKKPGKVIFDPYDILDGCIEREGTYKNGQMQRFSIEESDAIVCRDLRLRYLRETLGYKLPESTILFGDYCTSVDRVAKPILSRSFEDIHVVYCGSMVTDRTGTEPGWGMELIAQNFAQHGIHLHFYPHIRQVEAKGFKNEFSYFISLQDETKYFHLHDPVPMDKLSEELSQYHFGLNATHAMQDLKRHPSYRQPHYRYCSSARNIEYLDAGLPMILGGDLHKYQYWLFKRQHVAINASKEFFQDPKKHLLGFLQNPELPSDICKAQRYLSYRNNIGRLERFYAR